MLQTVWFGMQAIQMWTTFRQVGSRYPEKIKPRKAIAEGYPASKFPLRRLAHGEHAPSHNIWQTTTTVQTRSWMKSISLSLKIVTDSLNRCCMLTTLPGQFCYRRKSVTRSCGGPTITLSVQLLASFCRSSIPPTRLPLCRGTSL